VLSALLGAVLTGESFTLSQTYFFGRVEGRPAPDIVQLEGCCLDELEDPPAPVYPVGKPKGERSQRQGAADYDDTTDAELRAIIGCDDTVAKMLNLSRYDAMKKLSSRLAARGMAEDDIESVLRGELGDSPPPFHSTGQDPRGAVRGMARSAVAKFGESRACTEARTEHRAPPAYMDEAPSVESYAHDPEGQGQQRARENGAASFGGFDGTEGEPWPDTKPLEDALPPVEQFTPELLPTALRAWVTDVAERMQAPVEYVAVGAMVAAGAALGRKVAIRPKLRDDWHEFANLWGMIVGPPSWMKSPALDEARRPLATIEARELENFEQTHREWEADFEAAKARRDGAKERARTAAKKGQAFDKYSLVADPIPDEPQPPRLIVNDATVPALCEVLRANPNGVLVFRDELAGLIAELDREGMEGSRTFYLQGYSGKEGYVQDRIMRGTNLRVPHVCLSMLGGIQPSRVSPILRDSLETGGSDGFMARYGLAVWPDNPGEYRRMDREPDTRAREAAHAVYERLHALTPADVGAELVDGLAPFLRLEPQAAEAFMDWHVAQLNRLRSGVEDAALAAHLCKYPKLVAGVALLIHLADGGTCDVALAAVERALGWAELLESHARRLYASLEHASVEGARALLKHLSKGDLPVPFTVRQVQVKGWSHLADTRAAQAAVDVLEGKGWVRELPAEQRTGRPSRKYNVHPRARA
jgi:putative DNA primase/helicase